MRTGDRVSLVTFETTEHLIRAARCANTIPVVRTEAPEVPRVLDAGASAVMVPAVNSAAAALDIVHACKYPPLGRRSAAFTTRAGGYTFFGGPAQIQRVNEGVAVIAMIETAEAFANVDAIVDVKGIDGLFIGLSDLAISMGHAGDNMHPDVQSAVQSVIARARAAGIGAGLLAGSPADFNRYAKMGARFLPMTMASMIAGALREAIAMRRGALRSAAPIGFTAWWIFRWRALGCRTHPAVIISSRLIGMGARRFT